MRSNKPEKPKTEEEKQSTSISKVIGKSKRLTLTYIVLAIWIGLAVFGVLNDADLYGLSVYFASGLPLILGYLWSETSRPSLKDASEIIKNINNNNNRNRGRRNDYNPYDNLGFNNGNVNNNDNNNDLNINIYSGNKDEEEDVKIYSDDASVEIDVNQTQLSTLMNIGYVNESNDKYTFDKSLLSQIKSLLNDNIQEPEI
jgi:hypothetical protein